MVSATKEIHASLLRRKPGADSSGTTTLGQVVGSYITQLQLYKVRVGKVVNFLSNYTMCFFHLTTIPVEMGFLWDFVPLKLKTCSLYRDNLCIQKFKVISSQVLNNFFSASDIMEAVSIVMNVRLRDTS